MTSLLSAGAASAATNLLVNGDFEASPIASGYYNVGPAGADHPVPGDFGWTVSNGNVDEIAHASYGPPLANGGLDGLDLVGYGSTGQISQTVATALGQKYLVSFDYSANSGAPVMQADVLFNNVSIGTVTGNTGSWQHYTGYVFGTGSDTLAINEILGGGNGGVFLDNVSLSAVPETATWAMMLLGFFGLGGVLRYGRRARATATA